MAIRNAFNAQFTKIFPPVKRNAFNAQFTKLLLPVKRNSFNAQFTKLRNAAVFSTTTDNPAGFLSENNTRYTAGVGQFWHEAYSSLTFSTGVWYFEAIARDASEKVAVGWISSAHKTNAAPYWDDSTIDAVGYNAATGEIIKQGVVLQTMATTATGGVIGVLADLDADTIQFIVGGVASAVHPLTTPVTQSPFVGTWNEGSITLNGGHLPFTYTQPAGSVSLDSSIFPVVPNTDPQLIFDLATTPFNTPVNIDVLANDVNIAGGETLTVASQPSHGTAVVNGDGVTIDYTPNGIFSGIDQFTYDVNASGSPQAVQVQVTGTLALSGPVIETLAISEWKVIAESLDGTIRLQTITSSLTYTIPVEVDTDYVITGFPLMKAIWVKNLSVEAGDYITAEAGDHHIWVAQNAGTTGTLDPSWNLSGVTTDNGINWDYVDELPKPDSQGPIRPILV